MSKIFVLGPDGSYSSKAANKINKRLGYDIEYVGTIEEVINSTIRGFYGVIPIHNIYGGAVQESIDSLMKNKNLLQTLSFTKLRIDHCLASQNGESIEDIKTIYSHPQAIKQCEEYLNTIEAIGVPIASTIERIGNLQFGEGIICSQDAAQKSGISILNESISPDDNTTVFAFISNLEQAQIFKRNMNIA